MTPFRADSLKKKFRKSHKNLNYWKLLDKFT